MLLHPRQPRDKLIVALDFAERHSALSMVERLRDIAGMFKIGSQLFTSEGPAVVRELVDAGHKVFLDLKFHDIPNTVERAVSAAASLGVDLLNVHASGGEAMMRAAARAAAGTKCRVLAVTVLTSLDQHQLAAAGFCEPPEALALRLARLALDCGLHGVVAAPTEIGRLRRELGSSFLILSPGIRLSASDRQDQVRAATPAQAVRDGADYIVVGRPITAAPDPAAAARTILKMLE
jgi:orotidine-5'-phosphate decarboxylase